MRIIFSKDCLSSYFKLLLIWSVGLKKLRRVVDRVHRACFLRGVFFLWERKIKVRLVLSRNYRMMLRFYLKYVSCRERDDTNSFFSFTHMIVILKGIMFSTSIDCKNKSFCLFRIRRTSFYFLNEFSLSLHTVRVERNAGWIVYWFGPLG